MSHFSQKPVKSGGRTCGHMRLQLSGFEKAISVDGGVITVIEVHNRTLFSRVCQSLLSERAENAIEPYFLWDDSGKAMNPATTFKIVVSPLNLPWMDKDLGGRVYEKFEELFFESDSSRKEIENLYQNLQAQIITLGLQMQSTYSFALEWEMKKFLKAFNFAIDIDAEESLLDNMIRFLELLVDVEFKKTLLFINLKSFFSENDLKILYDQVIFCGKKTILLENASDRKVFEHEKKYTIDQDFIQEQQKRSVRSTSLSSGEFVPTVLEQ